MSKKTTLQTTTTCSEVHYVETWLLVNFSTGTDLPEGSCVGSRLQLMKQPHGMWIQRSDSTNNGVAAGASRVRKKLKVSRDELRAFSAWRTSTKVCEWKEGEMNSLRSQWFNVHEEVGEGNTWMEWHYKDLSPILGFFCFWYSIVLLFKYVLSQNVARWKSCTLALWMGVLDWK